MVCPKVRCCSGDWADALPRILGLSCQVSLSPAGRAGADMTASLVGPFRRAAVPRMKAGGPKIRAPASAPRTAGACISKISDSAATARSLLFRDRLWHITGRRNGSGRTTEFTHVQMYSRPSAKNRSYWQAERASTDLLWLPDEQLDRIKPYFPQSHGVPRADDHRVASGIAFFIRNGLRWRDAPRS